ncbi:MAG: hypothetical protein QE487_08985 [Fluviicola sp.]|nr:hypothetical protein [Fluviicola sp.]
MKNLIFFWLILLNSSAVVCFASESQDTLKMNVIYPKKESDSSMYSYGFCKYTGNPDSLIRLIEEANSCHFERVLSFGKKVMVCKQFTKPYLLYGGQSMIIKLNKKKGYTEVTLKMNSVGKFVRLRRLRVSLMASFYQEIIDRSLK